MILEDLNGYELGYIYSKVHLGSRDDFLSCELEISIHVPFLKEYIVIDSFYADPGDRENSPALLSIRTADKVMNSKVTASTGQPFMPEAIYSEPLGKIFNVRLRKNRENPDKKIGDNLLIQTDSGKSIEIFGSDFLPFNMIKIE